MSSTLAFKGTKAQEEELRQFIADHKHIPGALMPVLQKAQGIYGYLPEEVQQIIADGLDISTTQVSGPATS